jgi:drug/metabolite transporter (DMT)-like permease
MGKEHATSVALLVVTVILASYAQLGWKARSLVHAASTERPLDYVWAMLSDPWIWSVLLSTALGSISWMLALRRLELSVAFPAIAIVFVLIGFGAHFILGESLSAARVAGLALIIAGVSVVALTE